MMTVRGLFPPDHVTTRVGYHWVTYKKLKNSRWGYQLWRVEGDQVNVWFHFFHGPQRPRQSNALGSSRVMSCIWTPSIQLTAFWGLRTVYWATEQERSKHVPIRQYQSDTGGNGGGTCHNGTLMALATVWVYCAISFNSTRVVTHDPKYWFGTSATNEVWRDTHWLGDSSFSAQFMVKNVVVF
jgi:hypothetical protein